MSANIEIRMHVKVDVNGDDYLIGSPDLPANKNLNDFTFIVFYPEEGSDHALLILRPKK